MDKLFLRCQWVHLTKLAGVSGDSELAVNAWRSAIAGPQLSRRRTDRGSRRGCDPFILLLAQPVLRGFTYRGHANCSESPPGDRCWRSSAVAGTVLRGSRNLCSSGFGLLRNSGIYQSGKSESANYRTLAAGTGAGASALGSASHCCEAQKSRYPGGPRRPSGRGGLWRNVPASRADEDERPARPLDDGVGGGSCALDRVRKRCKFAFGPWREAAQGGG